jgi:hypothetical protein
VGGVEAKRGLTGPGAGSAGRETQVGSFIGAGGTTTGGAAGGGATTTGGVGGGATTTGGVGGAGATTGGVGGGGVKAKPQFAAVTCLVAWPRFSAMSCI